MNKFRALIVAMLVTGTALAQTNWTIDKEHSNIGFSVSHFGISQTTGYFKDFEAKVSSQAEDFKGAKVDFTAKTASVFTDNTDRDEHLKSEAFFDAVKYPDLKFKGMLVKEGNKYLLKGNLTIRDVTKPVSFSVVYGGRMKDDTFKIQKAGFKVTGKINRLDFGLKWNETFEGGGAIVGKEAEISLNIELNKQKISNKSALIDNVKGTPF